MGTALMFMAVAAFSGWVFVRRHQRDYSDSEYWRLVIYSFVWAASLEMFVLFAVFVMPQMEKDHVDTDTLLFAVPFTLLIDFAFAWLSIRQTGRRVIRRYLKNRGIGPNQPSEPTAMSVTPPAAQEPRQP